MSKLAPTSIKYIVRAQIKAKGVIEKPDVIGAIFGQTEGLLGAGLDLRELQRTGRIGRIEVNIKSSEGKSEGEIIIPSSLDSAETALIAATLETIERVGPCTAEIKLLGVEDVRQEKRKYVMDKAKEILKTMMDSSSPETNDISEHIKQSVRVEEITTYHGLPAGPAATTSEEIIVVEGRADVLLLLRYGINNTIAIEGTSIPAPVVDLIKGRTTILFVDGDRGGQLIAKELMQKAEITFIAVAPEGKEVEECTKKEVYQSLRERVPAGQFFSESGSSAKDRDKRPHGRPHEKRGGSHRRPRESRPMPHSRRAGINADQKELFRRTLEDIVGTRAAYILDSNNNVLGKVPITELSNVLRTVDDPYIIILDGRVTLDLNITARRKGVKFIIGTEKDDFDTPITVLSKEDLE